VQSCDDLDGFQCLEIPNHSSHDAQNPDLFARARSLDGRRLWKHASVAQSVLTEVISAKLAIILLRSAADQWFPEENGGVREEVSCRCVIGTIENDIVVLKEADCI
jgi:hypothetical protein